MIYVLLATGSLALFAVYLFHRHVSQQVAAAELRAHQEYQSLVLGLSQDANTIKAAIATKADAAVQRLQNAVK